MHGAFIGLYTPSEPCISMREGQTAGRCQPRWGFASQASAMLTAAAKKSQAADRLLGRERGNQRGHFFLVIVSTTAVFLRRCAALTEINRPVLASLPTWNVADFFLVAIVVITSSWNTFSDTPASR
jgi:hypothetical protein